MPHESISAPAVAALVELGDVDRILPRTDRDMRERLLLVSRRRRRLLYRVLRALERGQLGLDRLDQRADMCAAIRAEIGE